MLKGSKTTNNEGFRVFEFQGYRDWVLGFGVSGLWVFFFVLESLYSGHTGRFVGFF